MITAADALALPGAKISDSDVEVASQIVREVDDYVRQSMTRNGCVMPIDPRRVNGVIVPEVERRLRRLGWKAEFQMTRQQSALSGNQVVTGFQVSLVPSDEAYAVADAVRDGAA